MERFKSKSFLIVLLFSLATLGSRRSVVMAAGSIYIKADGTIEPSTAPILNVANSMYKFTDNIYDPVVIERSNIVVDGQDYKLSGSGSPGNRGIDLSGRGNVTIKNMEITTFDYGIYLDGSSNNTITLVNMSASNYNGIYLIGSANSNRIIGNKIVASRAEGIYLTNSSDNVITANDITNNKYGIRLYMFSDNNTIAQNNITASTGGSVYVTASSDYNDIAANTLANNGGYLYIASSANNTVAGNSMTNNGDGIFLDSSSDNNTIIGNTVAHNGGGISIRYYSSFNTMARNNIIANSGDGISLTKCANSTITENDIEGSGDGIFLQDSSNITIVANNLAGNGKGIELYFSSNNLIYHNNFNNMIQVLGLLNFTNTWDNGYPSGGNYWSDYGGNDSCSGPYQNETGSDGIGDSPYFVGGNNLDRYPLMTPYAIPEFTSVLMPILFMLATLVVATIYKNARRGFGHSLVTPFASMRSRFCAMRFAINGESICGPNAVRPTTRERAAFFTVVATSIDIAFSCPNLLVRKCVNMRANASIPSMKTFNNTNSGMLFLTCSTPGAMDPQIKRASMPSSALEA
jgi:parallel beta-helix repeat protein